MEMGVTTSGHEDSVWTDGNVLKLDCGIVSQLWEYTNKKMNYTL